MGIHSRARPTIASLLVIPEVSRGKPMSEMNEYLSLVLSKDTKRGNSPGWPIIISLLVI